MHIFHSVLVSGDPTDQTLTSMEKYTVLPIVKKKILVEGKCAETWQGQFPIRKSQNQSFSIFNSSCTVRFFRQPF